MRGGISSLTGHHRSLLLVARHLGCIQRRCKTRHHGSIGRQCREVGRCGRGRGRSLSTAENHNEKSSSSLAQDSTANGGRRHQHHAEKIVSILEDQHLLKQIPLQDVRQVAVIAHVDHGKSSLCSRLLELTGNLGREAQDVAWRHVAKAATADSSRHASHQDLLSESSSSSSLSDQVEASSLLEQQDGATTMHNNNDEIAGAAVSRQAEQAVTKIQKERIEALDTLSVEQQRGITVKASTASMLYYNPELAVGPTGTLLINVYDTPGHVDFGREVSRSLSFVQGAVLLLDATQGMQAQTWSVYEKVQHAVPAALRPELLIALTKIDLEQARPDHVALTVSEWLGIDDPDDSILYTSARSRLGIRELLDAICRRVPPPQPLADDNVNDDDVVVEHGRGELSILRAQVVDSWYDSRGVNCLVQIVSGQLEEGGRISMVSNMNNNNYYDTDDDENNATNPLMIPATTALGGSASYSVQEVGLVLPQTLRTKTLSRGQMGYVRFGLRDPRQASPGAILIHTSDLKKPMLLPTLPRIQGGPADRDASSSQEENTSVLYASVHPEEADEFDELCSAVERLALNDTGLDVQRTSSVGASEASQGGGPFLGPGLRVGFQGLLHVEVFRQRLADEFEIHAIVTPPKVPYRVTFLPSKKNNLKETETRIVEDLSEWPDPSTKYSVQEPMVKVRIVARVQDTGAVMDLLSRKRGTEMTSYPIMDDEQWIFTALVPWAEVVIDMDDMLKNATSGYGSMDTTEAGYATADLCKVDIVLNNDVVEPLAFVCHKDVAQAQARVVCQKLQQVLPRQQFVTVIQAKAGGKIIAAERIKAYRKDVLTKSGKVVGGGDQTRKMKLLAKQKKGKKRMQQSGKVQLSQAAFNSVMSRS